MKFEYPHTNLQSFDLDKLDGKSPNIISEALIRLCVLDSWSRDGISNQLLWSTEPEPSLDNGRLTITRLKTSKSQNARYNSSRRSITRQVDPASCQLKLEMSESSWHLFEVTRLRQQFALGRVEITRVRIAYSLAQPVLISSVGFLLLCYGYSENDSSPVVALSNRSESVVEVPTTWTVESSSSSSLDPSMTLLSLAAHIKAQDVLHEMPEGHTAIVHEPDTALASALLHFANLRGITICFTTSTKGTIGDEWTYVKTRSTRKQIRELLPRNASFFIDMSSTSASLDTSQRIAEALPTQCRHERYRMSSTTNLTTDSFLSSSRTANLLKSAWEQVVKSCYNVSAGSSANIRTLDQLEACSPSEPALVIDWLSKKAVAAQVQAIDCGNIFRSDRTYLLIGLSGAVGQSICEWMVKHEARHIVLTSRNPKVSGDWVRWLSGLEATVKVMQM